MLSRAAKVVLLQILFRVSLPVISKYYAQTILSKAFHHIFRCGMLLRNEKQMCRMTGNGNPSMFTGQSLFSNSKKAGNLISRPSL
jgi:hypothetical protein